MFKEKFILNRFTESANPSKENNLDNRKGIIAERVNLQRQESENLSKNDHILKSKNTLENLYSKKWLNKIYKIPENFEISPKLKVKIEDVIIPYLTLNFKNKYEFKGTENDEGLIFIWKNSNGEEIKQINPLILTKVYLSPEMQIKEEVNKKIFKINSLWSMEAKKYSEEIAKTIIYPHLKKVSMKINKGIPFSWNLSDLIKYTYSLLEYGYLEGRRPEFTKTDSGFLLNFPKGLALIPNFSCDLNDYDRDWNKYIKRIEIHPKNKEEDFSEEQDLSMEFEYENKMKEIYKKFPQYQRFSVLLENTKLFKARGQLNVKKINEIKNEARAIVDSLFVGTEFNQIIKKDIVENIMNEEDAKLTELFILAEDYKQKGDFTIAAKIEMAYYFLHDEISNIIK